MNVTMSVYQSGAAHKLTVVARPHASATLGEHVLMEGYVLQDVPIEPDAAQVLRAAYDAVADELRRRGAI